MWFERPLPSWKQLTAEIRPFLNMIIDDPSFEHSSIGVAGKLELEVRKRSAPDGDTFTLGIINDQDSGG